MYKYPQVDKHRHLCSGHFILYLENHKMNNVQFVYKHSAIPICFIIDKRNSLFFLVCVLQSAALLFFVCFPTIPRMHFAVKHWGLPHPYRVVDRHYINLISQVQARLGGCFLFFCQRSKQGHNVITCGQLHAHFPKMHRRRPSANPR